VLRSLYCSPVDRLAKGSAGLSCHEYRRGAGKWG
jgi:hypothetical protein